MTPRSPPQLSSVIVTGTVSRPPVGLPPERSRPVPAIRCILPVTTPVRPETGTPHRHLGRAAPASLASTSHVPSADAAAPRATHLAEQRAPEEHRDLRRSNPDLCRLRGGVHPLGRRPGVLRAEGVRQRPEALHELPRQPASRSGRRLRRPRHRRAARLRARRRSPDRASTSRSSARPAATRPRSRSSRGWTGRSTAPTASGRSSPD